MLEWSCYAGIMVRMLPVYDSSTYLPILRIADSWNGLVESRKTRRAGGARRLTHCHGLRIEPTLFSDRCYR